jgi:hypothetical protein
MIHAAVVPPLRRPVTSSSIQAGPDLGTVGEYVAQAFVGDVEDDRPGMWSAVTHEHPRDLGQRRPRSRASGFVVA